MKRKLLLLNGKYFMLLSGHLMYEYFKVHDTDYRMVLNITKVHCIRVFISLYT